MANEERLVDVDVIIKTPIGYSRTTRTTMICVATIEIWETIRGWVSYTADK